MGKKMRQINAALPQGLAYQCRVCGSALVNLHVLASLARGLAYPGNGGGATQLYSHETDLICLGLGGCTLLNYKYQIDIICI